MPSCKKLSWAGTKQEDRSQMSEARCQKPDVRNRMSDFSVFCALFSVFCFRCLLKTTSVLVCGQDLINLNFFEGEILCVED